MAGPFTRPGEGCRERRRELRRYPRSETTLLSFPGAPRNGLRPPRKISRDISYSKRTTRPIPSRKPSLGRRTTAATAGSPSRPCDRPRLATVTAIAPRRLGSSRGTTLTIAPAPPHRAAISVGSGLHLVEATPIANGDETATERALPSPDRRVRPGSLLMSAMKAVRRSLSCRAGVGNFGEAVCCPEQGQPASSAVFREGNYSQARRGAS
jgi:hypothetical protein